MQRTLQVLAALGHGLHLSMQSMAVENKNANGNKKSFTGGSKLCLVPKMSSAYPPSTEKMSIPELKFLINTKPNFTMNG